MKRILSLILSCILLLQPTVFAYSPSTGGGTTLDASASDKTKLSGQIDTSFFSIPRLSQDDVEKSCKKDLGDLQLCQETFKDINVLSERNVGMLWWCESTFGKDFKNNPRDICHMYKKHGVNRGAAWDAYEKASDPWEREGEYWQLSPSEIYDKYEQVSKDIAVLWDINPEYVQLKKQDRLNKVAMGIVVAIIAYEAGIILAPVLEGMGFPMSAQIASIVPFEARGIVSPLKFAIQAARTRFWVDLGITLSYMAMDTVFVESAFHVLSKLTEELQSEIQYNLDTGYTVETRNLLVEIVNNASQTAANQQEQEEIYRLNQELKEEVKKSIKTSDWSSCSTGKKREAIVTLYALEYIRSEMADISDAFRYREAAIDLAQVYFSGDLTDLHTDRLEVYNIAKKAYDARKEIERKKIEKKNEERFGRLSFTYQ